MSLFAKELLSLWVEGIKLRSVTYRFGIVNGIFDGKGFEQVTKTQGSCSHEGCNACNFSGYSFGSGHKQSVVYPFYNQYLPSGDSRREKRPTQVQHSSLLYNIRDETLPPPINRTYADYIRDGQAFQNRLDTDLKHVNGVKGIWAFDILPYAFMIVKTKDRMHTSEHVVSDALKIFSPSKDYHVNRSQKPSVQEACKILRIHPVLYTTHIDERGIERKEKIPWILPKLITDVHDLKLRNVVGITRAEIPTKILKRRKGRNTHESIVYGSNGWAQWCLYSPNTEISEPYIENKLKLFEILRVLNSSRIKLEDVESMKLLTIDALVEHSALFPPCESTYALHELIHLIDQIPLIGPPKFTNLFDFERVNSTLKRMSKNRCSPMASIARVYAVMISIFFILMHIKCVFNVSFMCLSCETHVSFM